MLQNTRHAINRSLKRAGCKFDITRHEDFTNSQEAYKDAARELKKLGKAAVKHYPEISPQGQYKISMKNTSKNCATLYQTNV